MPVLRINTFMPLMITATISYATIKIFTSNSVYTIQLAKRGELMTHDKDKKILKLMKLDNLIETNFKTIGPDKNLGDLVDVISKSTRNIYPVIDENETFLGIVFMDHIRHIMFKPELYDSILVQDLMFMPSPLIDPAESMEEITKKFHESGNYNLPVVSNGKYLGFISRARVFSEYRKIVKHFSED